MTRRQTVPGLAIGAPTALVLAALVVLGSNLAGTSTIAPDDSATAAGGSGPLDGKAFVGQFGPEGEPADMTDTLYFGSGQFWSANCVPCGFGPGIYWTRRADGGTHFPGKLHSDTGGTFTYVGVVRDGSIEVRINWQKDRWYWSIDRDFWFEGELAPGKDAGTAREAALLAEGVASETTRDCIL